jgi:hypothetical protein
MVMNNYCSAFVAESACFVACLALPARRVGRRSKDKHIKEIDKIHQSAAVMQCGVFVALKWERYSRVSSEPYCPPMA